MEAPVISWIRRNVFNIVFAEELEIKKQKESEILENWKEKAENMRLKIRESTTIETPYATYFFKYCQYCNNFRPNSCFYMNGTINTNMIINCAKLRFINKQLNQENK